MNIYLDCTFYFCLFLLKLLEMFNVTVPTEIQGITRLTEKLQRSVESKPISMWISGSTDV
jgi:hypothetical protein